VQEMIGPEARRIISLVIVAGWTGIIAAQFTAAAKIISTVTSVSYLPALVISGACIIAYCLLGGQLSVLKTDALQLGLMGTGLLLALWILFSRTGFSDFSGQLGFFNDSFGSLNLLYFLLVVGSGFIIGPDIFSRLLTARDGDAARGSALLAGTILVFLSAVIVLLGVWAREYVILPEGASVLPYLLENEIPAWLGILLSFGLISAIVSSSDTCLMSAAAIAEHDLFQGLSVLRTRGIILLMGLVSMVIAGLEADIISTLLLAFSLFNCGVIPPVLIAITAWPKHRLSQHLAIVAVLSGGGLGIAGKLSGLEWLTILGMAVSALVSLAGIRKNHP